MLSCKLDIDELGKRNSVQYFTHMGKRKVQHVFVINAAFTDIDELNAIPARYIQYGPATKSIMSIVLESETGIRYMVDMYASTEHVFTRIRVEYDHDKRMAAINNQSADKANLPPVIFNTIQHNVTKVKRDTIYGNIDITLNLTANSVAIGKKTSSIPFFHWTSSQGNSFQVIKYACIQAMKEDSHIFRLNSSSYLYDSGKSSAPPSTRS